MGFQVHIICIFACWSILGRLTETGAARSGFGTACDESLKCNNGQWLSCQENGTCGCVRPNEMVYDPHAGDAGKCVVKSGERCKYQIDDNGRIPLFEKLECVPNAQCGSHGTCACRPTFYESDYGDCEPQGIFGAQCTKVTHCRNDLLLSCWNETCMCSPGRAIYSPSIQQCVGLASQKCIHGQCTRGATCDGMTNTCNCNPDSSVYQDEYGRCMDKKSFGEPCTRHEECENEEKFLSCENGSCGCSSKKAYGQGKFKRIPIEDYNEYYCLIHGGSYCEKYHYVPYNNSSQSQSQGLEDQTQECVGKVYQNCNDNLNCVKNADCYKHKSEGKTAWTKLGPGQKFCVCDSGYAPTSTGHCGLGHGQECDGGEKRCSDAFTCTDGMCLCQNSKHQIYNQTRLRCASLVAGPCYTNHDCVPNTICTVDQNSSQERGRCECGPGYIENSNGQCDAAFGAPCHYGGTKCDTLAGLKCRNGVCSCEDTFVGYYEELRGCFGLLNSRCRVNSECGPGAECLVTTAYVSGRCKCKEGFEEDAENETCVEQAQEEDPTPTSTTTTTTPLSTTTTTASSSTKPEPGQLDEVELCKSYYRTRRHQES